MNTQDKQIEEMAKATIKHCEMDNQCGSCHWSTCNECLAEVLINAGYRKASEVAEDIIRILRAGGITEWRYPIVADIKKKYMVGENTQAVYKHRTPNGTTYITSEYVSAESEDTE